MAELPKRLQKLKDDLANSKKFIEVAGAKAGEAVMKDRIFNNGKSTDGRRMKTSSKEKYGAYSKSYGKYRERKGRRTDVQDNELTGELRRGLSVVENGNVVQLMITGADNVAKAMNIERLQGRPVYLTNEAERKEITETLKRGVEKLILNP